MESNISERSVSSITVKLPDSRSILSKTSTTGDFSGGRYLISLNGGGNEENTKSLYAEPGDTVAFDNLNAGDYTISGSYYIDEDCVAYGYTSVTVEAGETSSVSLSIYLNKASRVTAVEAVYTGVTTFSGFDVFLGYLNENPDTLMMNVTLSNGYTETVKWTDAEAAGLIEITYNSSTEGSGTATITNLNDNSTIGTISLTIDSGAVSYTITEAISEVASMSGAGNSLVVSGTATSDQIKELVEAISLVYLGSTDGSGSVSADETFRISLDLSGVTGVTEFPVDESNNEGLFDSCKPLEKIVIPACVKTLGKYCFGYCSNLSSVEFASGSELTTIYYAFVQCTSLTEITLPDNLTSIGSNAFTSSGLTTITLPDNLTSIDSYAFSSCSSLTSVTLPASLTSIGSNAFASCSEELTVVDNGSGTWTGTVNGSTVSITAENLTTTYVSSTWTRN